MPIRKGKREEEPGSQARKAGLGSGDPARSPFGREAEYPGYKNRSQAVRGGTRRKVIRGKISGVTKTAPTRREREMPGKEQVQAAAALIGQARQEQVQAEKDRKAADRAAKVARATREREQKQIRVNLAAQKIEQKRAAREQKKQRRAAATQAKPTREKRGNRGR